ncbi:Pyruvate carboxylase [Candida viswanathii]|uniref:Pyruvate carboxylase n=1 Tax=Candida viswanathii TaxID=5486 RepID=A0A367XZ27_9ASCO|nr:Pyruvate carboxylase [Candida viswanathii]
MSTPIQQASSQDTRIGQMRKESTVLGPMNKILVANRGEIPIRIFRTAHELSMLTVAIYSHEDRLSMHRLKADESYVIGKKGQYTPVGAYLQIDEIINIAKKHNVNMIHPGYGFLRKTVSLPEKSRKTESSGLNLAIENDVPVVPGTPGPIESVEEARAFVDKYGLPVIIKAAFGGGGRGMRVVREGDDIEDAFKRATSEAKTAFGNGTCFIERFLVKPKHIEVQLLADNYGNVIHLFERDCSVQRRHQKVVEIAPAKSLPKHVRDAILTDAVKLAKSANYRNAGTAEFLVDAQDRHYFIEINPRIQVEHTITEEITGVDLVAAQIQIAAGASLQQLGLLQDKITTRGFAIQCRITTEDPTKNFQPDTGKIEVYRSAGGNGVRLDGGNGFVGSIISPHYDSMLVKCSCSGSTYEIARRKMLRALIEFRIRGVKTNIPFLLALLTNDIFIKGDCWTTFIDDTPSLFQMISSQNRATKMLTYLADLVVNGSSIKGQVGYPKLDTEPVVPDIHEPKTGIVIDVDNTPAPRGWRQVLLEEGPEAFAKKVREFKGTMITDTTWRDAHQSLLATRVRTIDLVNIARTTAFALNGAFSLECWGGATFDVYPWARLRKLRALVPNIPFQMLLRGANGVAYSSLPDNAIDQFVKEAKDNGVGIDAVKKAGGVVEATVCYSGDMLKPGKKYNLEYYLHVVDEIVKLGTHFLGIKDMAGTLKPAAAKILIGTIRERYPDLPIHVHTHDSAGTGVASMTQCAISGADVVDAASNSMSGMTSQPSISSIETGLSESMVRELDNYWAQMRLLYSCFDADLKGQIQKFTSTKFQVAQQLGLGSQWVQTKEAYKVANSILGDLVKVTPTSKVVGDLAQFMVSNSLTEEDVNRLASELDFPDSVLDFFQGLMGTPYGGFPEPLRTNILGSKRQKLNERPGLTLPPVDFVGIKEELSSRYGTQITETDIASYVMYPKVFEQFRTVVDKYGDLSVLPTRYFLKPCAIGEELSVDIEQGKTLIIKLLAVGDISDKTGNREVFFELNGEMRSVSVEDRAAAVETKVKPKASSPNDVGAPMAGVVIEIRAHRHQEVKKGDPIAVLSAMKMEMVISSPCDGEVGEIVIHEGDSVDANDLITNIIQH